MRVGHHTMRFKFKSHDRFFNIDIPEGSNLNWMHVERYLRIVSGVCCDALTVCDVTGKDYTSACYMPPELTYIVSRTASTTSKKRCGRPCSWISFQHKHIPEYDVKGRLEETDKFLKSLADSSARAWRSELYLKDREYLNNTPKVAYGIPRDRLVQCRKNDSNAFRDTSVSLQYVALSVDESTSPSDDVIVPELMDYCKKTQFGT